MFETVTSHDLFHIDHKSLAQKIEPGQANAGTTKASEQELHKICVLFFHACSTC